MRRPSGRSIAALEETRSGPRDSDTARRLRPRDAAAIAALPDSVSAHSHQAGWYNNASFLLPFLAAVGTLIAWLVAGGAELLGISIFFFVVSGLMLPLVYLTWQRTATAIVLRESGIEARHQGRLLQSLAWNDVRALRRAETMGNVRWYVFGPEDRHLSLDGEIDSLDTLLDEICRLADVEREPGSRGA